MTAPDRFATGRKGIAETYAGEFALAGAALPLQALEGSDRAGRIADAAGTVIARVNPEGRSELEQQALARLIAQGVNWFANMRSRS